MPAAKTLVTAFSPSIEPISSPDADLGARRHAELELDDVSEHPCGELREADAPDARRLLEQPVVRRRIAAIGRQVRREPRPAVIDGVDRAASSSGARPSCTVRSGSTAATRACQSGSVESAHHENRSAPSRPPRRQPHRAQHVAAGIALRGARGAVRDRDEIAPGVDDGLRLEARKREVEDVGHRSRERRR